MSEHYQGDDVITAQSGTHRSLTRRGLVAGATALAAGLVATQATQPVAAGADGDVVLGASNSTTGITRITNTTTTSGTIALALTAENGNNGVALLAVSSGTAVSASSSGATGVTGASSSDTGFGVDGIAQNNAGGTGVRGRSFSSTGIGVLGTSTAGTGVRGDIPTPSSAANTIAVFGNNLASGANGIGVYGSCANGTGIYGQTAASNQYGVLGATYATNSTAIAGACSGDGSSAFSGGTTNPNAFAGVFQGTVVVTGNFAVTGSKSAVIQHPRTGDHRLVYCVESPEAWFEDFGEATLAGGRATVTLDPDFAALIHSDAYHVFLTSHDPTSKGLAIAARTTSGFTVQEHNGGTTSGTFSWRVVGKRSDVKPERLGKFTMPNLPLPDPAKFKAPETPTVAAPPKKP